MLCAEPWLSMELRRLDWFSESLLNTHLSQRGAELDRGNLKSLTVVPGGAREDLLCRKRAGSLENCMGRRLGCGFADVV
jgi:hypothetical protein